MKTALVLILTVASLFVTAHAGDDDDRELEKKMREIKKLKERVHDLKEWIDELNEHVCQSGSAETEMCKADNAKKLFRCLTQPMLIKNERQEYEKRTETRPVVAVGVTGLRYLCGVDFELDAKGVNNAGFTLEVKSDDFLSPSRVRSDYYSCPSALNYKSRYEN